MKVIHLPVNISSQISTTVRALRSVGVDARGLARKFTSIQSHSGIETVNWSGHLTPTSRLWRGIRWRWKLVRAVAWADVVHWHWGDSTWKGMDLFWIKALGKPRLVEFWGDDVREPGRASRDNSFLAQLYQQHPEDANFHSEANQLMFARHGFACLIPGYELADYLNPSLFPGYYQTRPRILLEDYPVHLPDPAQNRPLLVHAPSHKGKKGTDAVLAAVATLQKTHAFEFRLIHEMPREQALATVARADVFLDQFVVGAEGLAALEAMAFGKPVVCYIKPSLQDRYPAGFPLVVADQTNLVQTIAGLLERGSRRRQLGAESRKYVELYHDAKALAVELAEIYEEISAQTRRGDTLGSALHCRHWQLLKPAQKGAAACVA